MQRPLYIDNRAVSKTSKGVVCIKQPLATISPLLPAGSGYGKTFLQDVGDFFSGKTARKEAKAYKRRQDQSLKDAELALIASSAEGTEVTGPSLLQWSLLVGVTGLVLYAITR